MVPSGAVKGWREEGGGAHGEPPLPTSATWDKRRVVFMAGMERLLRAGCVAPYLCLPGD